nr:2-C-methyl-D-erythritol 4-phosphate cytidylyltransferase [Tessaracoccus coleopterorum]
MTIPEEHRAGFEAALAGTGAVLAVGGATRQDSVRLGLAALTAPDDAVVLIHDAARALVPPGVVASVARALVDGAAAVIPVVPVVDSIRALHGDDSSVVDRSVLRAVQTRRARGSVRCATPTNWRPAKGLRSPTTPPSVNWPDSMSPSCRATGTHSRSQSPST